MSTISAPVRRIRAIAPHSFDGAREYAVLDDRRSLVRKGAFGKGDLVVFIPKNAFVPGWLSRCLNDVSGVCEESDGWCYPVIQDRFEGGQIVTGDEDGAFANVREGDDAARLLGLVAA